MDNIIIAIDGYASTGKSSLAKAIAKHLNFVYVDSGSMYRAITYYALKNNLIPLSRPNLLELKNKLSKINLNFVYNKELGFSRPFALLIWTITSSFFHPFINFNPTIKDELQMSKKAFKKALGSLYKQRLVKIKSDGIYLNIK